MVAALKATAVAEPPNTAILNTPTRRVATRLHITPKLRENKVGATYPTIIKRVDYTNNKKNRAAQFTALNRALGNAF